MEASVAEFEEFFSSVMPHLNEVQRHPLEEPDQLLRRRLHTPHRGPPDLTWADPYAEDGARG